MIRDRIQGLFGQEEGPIKQYIWNVQDVRHNTSTGDVHIWGQEEKDRGPIEQFKFELVSNVEVLGVNTAQITSELQGQFIAKIRAHSRGEQSKRGAVVARYKASGTGYRNVLVFYEKVHEELM